MHTSSYNGAHTRASIQSPRHDLRLLKVIAWLFSSDDRHVTVFRPITEPRRRWSYNVGLKRTAVWRSLVVVVKE